MVRLIIFDLDHTLLSANCSFRFGLYLYHKKLFSFLTLLFCFIEYIKHKWFGRSVQTLHNKSFSRLFKGKDYKKINDHVDRFLNDELSSMLYSPVVERLKNAQNNGDRVVILSSSPDFLVRKIADRLGVNQWKATVYQIDEKNRFHKVQNILEGGDKADYAKDLVKQMQIPLSALTVYSDSYLDLPILQMAGEAIGVRPDYHLRRICLKNGWEIL